MAKSKQYVVEGMYGTNQKSFTKKSEAINYAKDLSKKSFNSKLGVKVYSSNTEKYDFYKKGDKFATSKNPYNKTDKEIFDEYEKGKREGQFGNRGGQK